MKSYIKIICIVVAVFTVVSCEKKWDKYDNENLEMNLFILAEADSTIRGIVMPVIDYFSKYTPMFFANSNTSTSVTNAITAYYSVNDGKKELLDKVVEDRETKFLSKPGLKAGDKVSLDLRGYYYSPVSASTVIPDKPQVEYEYLGHKKDDSGSYMQIKVKIKDNGEKKNYYMLDVGSNTVWHIDRFYRDSNVLMQSFESHMQTFVFNCKDPIFVDNKVTNRPYDMGPENFSNIFSDNLFNGEERQFIIECPIDMPTNHTTSNNTFYSVVEKVGDYVDLTLYEFSEDYYNYCKTWEHADDYKNGVLYFSNVDGGFGIFGSLNKSKTVRFDFKEKSLN